MIVPSVVVCPKQGNGLRTSGLLDVHPMFLEDHATLRKRYVIKSTNSQVDSWPEVLLSLLAKSIRMEVN